MNSRKHRLQFDFSDEAMQRFDKLAELIDASTRSEVLRNALRVYEYLVDKAKKRLDLHLSADELHVITGVKSSSQIK
jgi:metal-responsive CopG/Arc/MetJ family transcriptional regulator